MINNIPTCSIVMPKIHLIKKCNFEKINRNKKWFMKQTPLIKRHITYDL
jgi:hypothetical protein